MLRVLKRIVLLLFAFVVAMAATLYVLYFRRTALPSAALHARVVPVISSNPGLSACWVETAYTFSSFSFGVPARSILFRHPPRALLLDTGCLSNSDKAIS